MSQFKIGQSVRLQCTDFVGPVKAIYPNYEGSEEYAYAVEMSLLAQAVGMTPIEVVSEHLISPASNIHPRSEVNNIASRFAWGLLHLMEGTDHARTE